MGWDLELAKQGENARERRSGLPSIGARELAELVSMDDAIVSVDAAMRAFSAGDVWAPERWAMPVTDHASMGLMPGASLSLGRFGIKVLSLFPGDQRGALPSHQGVMLLLDLATGEPLCSIEANALTTLRTAAASAVATRALAREDSSRLAIVGCGEQARLHVDALCRIRPIRSIVIWNRTPERAAAFAGTLSSFDGEVDVMDSVREAIQHADIICTLTAASEPILFGRDLVPGQHLNIVGSSTKTPREIDDQAVARGRYIADSKAHASSQGAELISAISSGMVANDHLLGEIGEVLAGRVVGRLNEGDITLYKSLGHIIQDLAVADLAYKRWRARTP